MERSEVVVVDEPRVLQPYELIVTGCCVKRGKSWMYGNDNGTPDAIGVVLSVREDGMVLVRWPNKSKNYYRYGADGYFDLEICSPHEDQTLIGASNHFTPKMGSADADVSLLGQTTSSESHKKSDAHAEVHLDWNESSSRVSSKSYWAKMAHEELKEGLKNPVSGVHTVLCVDTSASIMQGSAWGQTQQFFTEFITELQEVRREVDVNTVYVALSVFGADVKVVQRLTNDYTLLKHAFSTLQPSGPSPLYAGLLMAAAGLQDTRTSGGITIRPQIILITDGHPTNSLISDGPDVCYSEDKEEDDVLSAVIAIATLNVELHCIPVGDANVPFLAKISAQSHGKLFSYQDGRILARRSPCDEDVVPISHETLYHLKDDKTKFHLDHYEIDDFPCLGTRVRRGPDWTTGFQDNDGPGTIVSHHKNQKQVKVEWDKSGHTDFYRYGDLGKYDVLIDSEPRVLQSERIATGCLVRRGKQWKYDNQDGTPGAVGVVLKVKEDGTVVVRWPNKYIGHYRYRTDGYYDLEICNPNDIQVESHMPEFHRHGPSLDLPSTNVITEEKVEDKYTILNKIEKLQISSDSIHEKIERSIIQKRSGANVEGVPVEFDRINHIYYKKEDILGHGCNGTIVFRGKFDKRDVAVKRLLKEYFSLAEQEVKLLRESDQHPNVIRYFWMEEDIHFLFIALELCDGNLEDYVENKLQNIINIEPIDILHQALNGLAHLHSLGIVHRDIKPQNILISKPNSQGEVRAMISDFGFSKKLPPEKMAFSSRSNVLGTEGWISPEMLKSGHKRTTAVDIFSAGCMMHYALTKGLHPFGNYASEIQCNIRQGKFNLGRLPMTSDGCIAKDIIEKMLSGEPQTRPTAKVVLNHLLFWKKTEKLQFIEVVSDWIMDNMVHDLEQDEATIVNCDWTIHLSQELQNDIKKDSIEKAIQYSGSSVKDLLRVIRNKKLHYNKMPEDVRKSVGSLPDEYLDYFTSRFPLLMLHTYRGMECCAKEDTFKAYYKTE
ncbi:hypothetical protein CHS0354_038162 [Potamilus streckersoni]|uniref:non-specific serine/threonine protein kinase n=1 Tax=Potamilus streckersoni TaxID=2493646 RepID=A0AAE0TEY1_9BIVA|nr:hypothetical protein CHS0354_038162 [Potamilus streckersoni]